MSLIPVWQMVNDSTESARKIVRHSLMFLKWNFTFPNVLEGTQFRFLMNTAFSCISHKPILISNCRISALNVPNRHSCWHTQQSNWLCAWTWGRPSWANRAQPGESIHDGQHKVHSMIMNSPGGGATINCNVQWESHSNSMLFYFTCVPPRHAIIPRKDSTPQNKLQWKGPESQEKWDLRYIHCHASWPQAHHQCSPHCLMQLWHNLGCTSLQLPRQSWNWTELKVKRFRV